MNKVFSFIKTSMIDVAKYSKEVGALLNRPIVLVGLMGAGKTTVGRLLAQQLAWPFYDSDDEIVRSVGKSIAKIFMEDGEPTFRELERQTILGLLKNGPCIIATGGGAITIPETAKAIIENSLCLWLDAPVDVLVKRTEGSDRPLLQHGDPEEVLTHMFEKRKVAYAQAHLHILDDGLSPSEMSARILMQIREYLFSHSSDAEEEKHIPQVLCLTVSLSNHSYPIFVGAELLEQPDIWLSHDLKDRRAFILTDYTVREIITDKFQAILKPHMKSVTVMELPPGEQTKSFDRYQAVLEWLLENGIKRDSIIFAVGGGVIGDLAGFAASTILRGVDFIQIPTTIQSQVDSSVGGKTGINSRTGKNLIGTFYQPKAVIIDPETLSTLPLRERLSGYAEIVKYGLLGDIEFFEWLEENGPRMMEGNTMALIRGIETSCRMKAEIVQEDEHETTGQRALLNLGHTFGHALESLSGYDGRILHGEAVAIGMVLAARLSSRLGYLSEDDVMRVKKHLQSIGLKTEIHEAGLPTTLTPQDFIELMRKDKKSTDAGMVFVVLKHLGKAELAYNVPEELVADIIEGSLKA